MSDVPCCGCVMPIEKKLSWLYSLRFGMRLLLLYVLFFTNIIYLKYPNFPSTGACYTDRSFAMSIWQCILHGGVGRGYSFHLWVGVCRWDPKTLGLYQTMYSRKFATLLQTGHLKSLPQTTYESSTHQSISHKNYKTLWLYALSWTKLLENSTLQRATPSSILHNIFNSSLPSSLFSWGSLQLTGNLLLPQQAQSSVLKHFTMGSWIHKILSVSLLCWVKNCE